MDQTTYIVYSDGVKTMSRLWGQTTYIVYGDAVIPNVTAPTHPHTLCMMIASRRSSPVLLNANAIAATVATAKDLPTADG